MKKILFILLSFVAVLVAKGQKEFNLLTTRIEGTNFDKRGNVGFFHFTSPTIVGDFRAQMDGRSVYSLSVGPVLSKRTHDELRLSIMPGIAYSFDKKTTFYSGALFFKAEEIRGKETFFYIKGMNSFSGIESRWVAEGEFLFSLSNVFKFGPSVSSEIEKYKYINGTEVIKYSGILNIAGRTVVNPLKWEHINITGLLGWSNQSEDSKTQFGFFKSETKNHLIFQLGLQLNFY